MKSIKKGNRQYQFHSKNMLLKLDRIIREMDKLRYDISLIDSMKGNNLPICSRCGIRNVRVRLNKSYFCTSCGYDSGEKVK